MECAFCGQPIERSGWDPCSVQVSADKRDGREVRGWTFGAHAACVVAAMHPVLRNEVAGAYAYPPEDENL
jgi:hypothetical protein